MSAYRLRCNLKKKDVVYRRRWTRNQCTGEGGNGYRTVLRQTVTAKVSMNKMKAIKKKQTLI